MGGSYSSSWASCWGALSVIVEPEPEAPRHHPALAGTPLAVVQQGCQETTEGGRARGRPRAYRQTGCVACSRSGGLRRWRGGGCGGRGGQPGVSGDGSDTPFSCLAHPWLHGEGERRRLEGRVARCHANTSRKSVWLLQKIAEIVTRHLPMLVSTPSRLEALVLFLH